MLRLPDPVLVVLVGVSGSGKSTWATANAQVDEIASSDRLRAFVGESEHDLRASADAFDLLDRIVAARLARRRATLDVLSGGRAVCGLGLAWFEQGHRAYGWLFPPTDERYDLLEDALRFLPVLWGPGSPSFEGKATACPGSDLLPRPLQAKVPILVGGSGERRTLRLVAQLADARSCRVRHRRGLWPRHRTCPLRGTLKRTGA